MMLRLVGFLFVFFSAVQAVAVCPSVLSDCTATPGYKNLSLNGGYLLLGNWTTSGRPSPPVAGMTGFNSTIGATETYNGSAWVSGTGSGLGTVTSVGLLLPASIFAAPSAPVTTSGTLADTLATQVANAVFAGPTSGSAAQPTFRALVGADLPAPSSSSLGGVQSATAVTHQFITSISTAGVPSLAQPGAADITGLAASATTDATNATNIASGLLAVARGGTGTASPGLVAGTNVTIAGSWPNQTVNSSGSGGSLTVTDGTHTVTGTTQISVTGGVIGGTTPNSTLTISGSSGLTVNSTTISGGAAAHILADDGTKLQEIAETGTGLVVLATSPSISGLTATGSFTATGLVTNADLVNSSMTIAGHAVALGGTQTVACLDLSNGAAGCSAAPANPTATAGPTANNGSGTAYMLANASPAVQKAGAAQFGIIEPDNATMLCPSGVCSTTLTDTVHSSGTVTTANIGGEDDYASGAAGATLAILATGQSLLVADLTAGALPIGLNGQTVTGCPLPTSLHNAGFYAFTFNSASTVSCYGNPGYGTITAGALTKFLDGSGALGAASAADLPATPLLTGTSTSLVGPRQYYVCTSTCTVTPPVPAAGYEFCVQNDVGVSTVITMAAIGSSARYGKTDQSAYGTAGTGTFISGGAAGDKVCLLGKDATHYNTASSNGTWTAN